MWDDLRVSAYMTAVNASMEGESPTLSAIQHNSSRGPSYSGISAYLFRHACDRRGVFQNAHFSAQLPHGYSEGSPIEPHVHLRLLPGEEARAGQVLLLEFEYVWSNIGEHPIPPSTIISRNYQVEERDLDADNLLISFGMIEKPNATISSMLSCRFSRICFGDRWDRSPWVRQGLKNDSFQGPIAFLEFDFHYQLDSPGSRELYKKG